MRVHIQVTVTNVQSNRHTQDRRQVLWHCPLALEHNVLVIKGVVVMAETRTKAVWQWFYYTLLQKKVCLLYLRKHQLCMLKDLTCLYRTFKNLSEHLRTESASKAQQKFLQSAGRTLIPNIWWCWVNSYEEAGLKYDRETWLTLSLSQNDRFLEASRESGGEFHNTDICFNDAVIKC